MTKFTDAFIKEMPKSDLHLHLDGSMRIPSLIEMAKKMKVELPSYTEEGLRELVFKDKYSSLPEYLNGFQYTCAVLRDLENIERVAYELAVDNQLEGVNYIEARFAPQLMMDTEAGLTMERVLEATHRGFERAKREYNNSSAVKTEGKPEFHYGIISCAMRKFGPKGYSPFYTRFFKLMEYSKEMEVIAEAALQMVKAVVKIRDEKGIPVVGIDLAGQEEGYPPSKFKDVYSYAHKHFMHKTVHAGEAYGAESIFQAITQLYADRIGHGYYLFDADKISDKSITDREKYIQDLASYIADKRVVIEVCLTSNLQTNPEIKEYRNHKFKDMIDNRMAVTICTDNRLVSNTTVSNEYRVAIDNFDIPLKRLKDIVAYGFKKSFHPGHYVEKRDYAKQCMMYFDKVAEKHGILS
jgi:adenosine deaminase